jgi:hypothetical protein
LILNNLRSRTTTQAGTQNRLKTYARPISRHTGNSHRFRKFRTRCNTSAQAHTTETRRRTASSIVRVGTQGAY